MESFKRFVQAALNQATSPSPVNQMELERARIEWERDDMPDNPWRAAGRPGVEPPCDEPDPCVFKH